MALVWRDVMAVGNKAIDRDHQYLVCMVNTVELILKEGEEKKLLIEILNQLYNYAQQHFLREERIQFKVRYPEYREHKKKHQELLTELQEMIKKVSANNQVMHLGNEVDHLVQFLRTWLLEHVLSEDMLLKPYVRKYPDLVA